MRNPSRDDRSLYAILAPAVRRICPRSLTFATNGSMDSAYLSLAEASRRAGRPSWALKFAIRRGKIDVSNWPRVSGRPVVPLDELPKVRAALKPRRRQLQGATNG